MAKFTILRLVLLFGIFDAALSAVFPAEFHSDSSMEYLLKPYNEAVVPELGYKTLVYTFGKKESKHSSSK